MHWKMLETWSLMKTEHRVIDFAETSLTENIDDLMLVAPLTTVLNTCAWQKVGR